MLPPVTMHGRVAVAHVSPATMAALEDHRSVLKLADALHSTDADDCVLSFRGINRITSLMLGGLLILNRLLAAHGWRVVLSDMNDDIRSVFDRTRLCELLSIEPTADDAVRSLSTG